MSYTSITTLGQLKESGYHPLSVKEEIRKNLLSRLARREKVFEGILGFDDTVLPDVERALLSRHNILLLGLRGQAKTRIARMMTQLLDEYIPIVDGSEINDDPLRPLSRAAIDLIQKHGDDTPVRWVHRDTRFVEKLATPDVSVADLIGDVDPIKAAALKLPYSDERVIHFGLVPRAHRSIFVLNELPDLQARIQVSLFNILQEGDLQIRGFKLRFPLDIQFVFTANPEDYTNRGSIVTPLKDRIESQILTHYPKNLETALAITAQEADIITSQKDTISAVDEVRHILELISFKARESEYIDEKSGVSARMSISAMENLYSTAERRMILNADTSTSIRITDFWGVVPSITGKVELVYEGEQEGPYGVAMNLVDGAIKELFLELFPDPDKASKSEKDPYGVIRAWFSSGNHVDLLNDDSEQAYRRKLDSIEGLDKLIEGHSHTTELAYFFKELILHGLAAFDIIGKSVLDTKLSFVDPLARMFDDLDEED
ncbi:MAG: magnesium chelatase [Bacteroidota bacterium]